MKKIIFLLIVSISISCSTDDSEMEASSSSHLIKTFTKYTTSGTVDFTMNYEYDSLDNIKKITKIKGGVTTETIFEYDNNNTMISFEQIETYSWSDEPEIEQNILEYQGDLVVKNCIYISTEEGTNTDNLLDKILIEYDTNNNPIKYVHYESIEASLNSCEDVDTIEMTENLEYDSNGNMIRYQTDGFIYSGYYYTYEYDNAHHPFSGVKPEVFGNLLGFSTVNNISNAIEYYASTGGISARINYDIEYNDDNYPTRIIKNYVSESFDFTQLTKYEYEYY